MHNRSEVIERLREHIPPDESQPSQDSAGRSRREWKQTLIAAADLLEAGEGHTEYRVTSDARKTYPFEDLKWCKLTQGTWERCGYPNVRIQERTVTETEWTDLEEADQ